MAVSGLISRHVVRRLPDGQRPLGTTADKQGQVAGENAIGGNRELAGSLGTQVVKVFDQAAGTGLRDYHAKAAGLRLAAPGGGTDGCPGPAPRHPAALTRPDLSRGTTMSMDHQRPVPQPGHTAHPAIRATLAVIIFLALAACGATTTTSAPASVLATGSPGYSGHTGTLTGSGSTFVAPFFAVAFARYVHQHPAVTINYSAVGSSGGIAAFSAGRADFGASDVPMTASEQAAAKGGSVVQVPDALGGEGVVYNLNLPAGARLRLTGPVIARIFLGQVIRWDDPAIAALNPGLSLPSAPISVVHRSDGSGTTYIFSNYLSGVDPAWAARVGTGKTLNWPVGEGAEGNGSVASTVYRTPFSIGYVEQAYSQGLLLRYAEIRNQAGRYVIPSTQSVLAAAAQKPGITPTDFSIVNQPGADSYPISGYSWALAYARQPARATGQALVRMLDWLTHDGQACAAANGYVPLPPRVRQLARTMLRQITGPTGTHLLG